MITLREYQSSDSAPLLKYANNPQVTRYLTDTFPSPYTEADATWWLSTGCKQGITRVIEYQGEFAGAVGAIPQHNEYRFNASIGYWLGQPFWGRGIASQALEEFTDFVFSNTDLIRLSAGIYSPNKASMRVAEKAGYSPEAVLKRSVFKHGEFYDEHIWSKIKGS